jgi:F0F1-type ATP synthase alpha subunit
MEQQTPAMPEAAKEIVLRKPPEPQFIEIGTVLSVTDGVALVFGLKGACVSELVRFQNNMLGMTLNLNKETTSIVIFGNDSNIYQGDIVIRERFLVNVPVGYSILGRVVNSLGEFIDENVNSAVAHDIKHR